MRFFNAPVQSAAIFEEFPTLNTGGDEIIPVGKDSSGQYRIRTLIQFDLTNISQSLVNGTIPPNCRFDLQLYIATASYLRNGAALEFHPLSQSWNASQGYYYQQIQYLQPTEGVTWSQTGTGSIWSIFTDTWALPGTGSTWTISGSSFISASTSGSINFPLTSPPVDPTVDITTVVNLWLSGTLPNYGLLCKFPDIAESSSLDQGQVSFFSKHTHTIYVPQIITKWNDQIFITGALSSSVSNPVVVPYDASPKYRLGDMPRIDLVVREKYPIKTFDNVFNRYANSMYIPSSSFYSIVDDYSGLTIIPFDQYSPISLDSNGNYFILPIQGMFPLRFYRIFTQTIISGSIQRHDHNVLFQVVP